MILQALSEYYQRKATNDSSSIAPEGFEYKEIPFVLVLDRQGNIVNLESTYEDEGKSKRAKSFLIPKAVKKTSGIASNLLWENPEYALGISAKNKPKRVLDMHEKFKEKINSLEEVEDDGLKALKLFLDKPNKLNLLQEKAKTDKSFDEILKQLLEKSLPMTFRLQGESNIIVESDVLREAVKSLSNSNPEENEKIVCLVTGNRDFIEQLHPAIKGVWGGQSTGSNIVSFNSDAYCSYDKKKGYNAPVGKKAAFAYTTALNTLLSKDSNQRIQVGDASTVFWAAKPSGKDFEKTLYSLFSITDKDNPDKGTEAVKSLYKLVENGVSCVPDGDNEFYVLGLSPNAARISVRFWVKSTIAQMAYNISQHFKDLRIVRSSYEKEFLSLFRLLVSTAVQGKADNIAPHLAGDFMSAILKNLPYPTILLQLVMNRIKAEQKIDYPRAALIKAYLNRLARANNKEEEIEVNLNTNNENQGYVLGRLFAALEKIQEEAQGETNSTIMRYYGSASSTPVTVFSTLMKLHHHHLDKLGKVNKGRAVNFEKLVSEITSKIDDTKGYSSHLSLADQGMFSIGYYQQRQEFFTKKEKKDE
jgi:CRISPR-associated protein Csd1